MTAVRSEIISFLSIINVYTLPFLGGSGWLAPPDAPPWIKLHKQEQNLNLYPLHMIAYFHALLYAHLKVIPSLNQSIIATF